MEDYFTYGEYNIYREADKIMAFHPAWPYRIPHVKEGTKWFCYNKYNGSRYQEFSRRDIDALEAFLAWETNQVESFY